MKAPLLAPTCTRDIITVIIIMYPYGRCDEQSMAGGLELA